MCLAEGNRKAAEGIKEALAMGADEAVVIDDPALAAPDQAAVAAALAAAVKKIGACDLLLFGEGSTDNYTGQVGARVAELLGLPQIGYARKIEAAEGGAVRCERSMDDMIETLEAPLPAVVTVVSEINEPRIPGLMQIMKAKSKPLQVWALADLGPRGAGAGARDRQQPGGGTGPQAHPVRGHRGRTGRRLRQCPHQRRRPGEVTMAALLVYSERVETARELVAGGKELAAALGLGVSAVALGPGAGAAASELAAAGADTVYVSEDAAFEGWPADAVAAGLAQIAEQAGASVVLVGSTRRGKETAPRLAQKLGAGCVTDVSSLVVEDGALVAGALRLRRGDGGAREAHHGRSRSSP